LRRINAAMTPRFRSERLLGPAGAQKIGMTGMD